MTIQTTNKVIEI